MAYYKIVRKSDSKILQSYESDKKELRTGKYGGELDDPLLVEHLQVPDGVDPNGVVVIDQEDPTAASKAYEGVTYTANQTGAEGNNIALVFDGNDDIATVVQAWNDANPEKTVSHDAGDDTVVPSAGTVQLENGDDGGLALQEDAATLEAWQKEQNLSARALFIAEEEKTAENAIASALGLRQKETQLMFAVNHIFEYLKSLQTAASILDGDMSQAGQDAKTALADMQTNMLGPANAAMATRDSNVQGFSLPYPSAGLPDGYTDYYTEL